MRTSPLRPLAALAVILCTSVPGDASAQHAVGTCDGAEWFIPGTATSFQDAAVTLRYSYPEGANRPMADLMFADGYEMDLSVVCPGEYSWRISVDTASGSQEACMKMDFSSSRRSVTLQLKKKPAASHAFGRHLTLIPRQFKKATCIKSGAK